ncbi:MAG: SDR family NAD(P)-dependent oxidoreductase, partial [Pseudomonadales bacterium]|nr:SDR family NAD(P)-dependent oxidoreductase [Pseudomonadales bacterium]
TWVKENVATSRSLVATQSEAHEMKGKTILITGGSEGVGLELARQLVENNKVIVCGRSQEKLDTAKSQLPSLIVRRCDVTDPAQRQTLIESVVADFPGLSVLLNNAGAKTLTPTLPFDAAARRQDFALNFEAAVELIDLVLPHFLSRPDAMIVNVTTGLVYVPKAGQAWYCAAKSALSSVTRSLRWALRNTSVSVVEVALPVVATAFHGEEPASGAMNADLAARQMLDALDNGSVHIDIGKSRLARFVSAFFPVGSLRFINK